jgi:ATP synthase in type III secretion protein N
MSFESDWRQPPTSPFGDGLRRLRNAVSHINTRQSSGRLLAVSGTLVRADLPGAEIGELCELRDPDTGRIRC